MFLFAVSMDFRRNICELIYTMHQLQWEDKCHTQYFIYYASEAVGFAMTLWDLNVCETFVLYN